MSLIENGERDLCILLVLLVAACVLFSVAFLDMFFTFACNCSSEEHVETSECDRFMPGVSFIEPKLATLVICSKIDGCCGRASFPILVSSGWGFVSQEGKSWAVVGGVSSFFFVTSSDADLALWKVNICPFEDCAGGSSFAVFKSVFWELMPHEGKSCPNDACSGASCCSIGRPAGIDVAPQEWNICPIDGCTGGSSFAGSESDGGDFVPQEVNIEACTDVSTFSGCESPDGDFVLQDGNTEACAEVSTFFGCESGDGEIVSQEGNIEGEA